MRQVLFALVPGVIAHIWYFGWGTAVQIVIGCTFAVLFEAAMLRVRGKPLRIFLTDYSALITAVLFCLCIPQLAPWWVNATGMFFAIVVAKHLYGGLGFNLFNPAMVGWVVVLIAFPKDLTAWLPPAALAQHRFDLVQTVAVILTGHVPAGLSWDAITQATPLDTIQTKLTLNMTISEIKEDPIFGRLGGVGWETIAMWYAVGGLWLMYKRVITWHIPVAVIAAVLLAPLPFYLMDPDRHLLPVEHIFTGSLVLGAFFVATDPVTSSTTPRGRIIFGAGVGILALVIRRWGTYPDGVGFAVLIMNMAVPVIDQLARPRVYGRPK